MGSRGSLPRQVRGSGIRKRDCLWINCHRHPWSYSEKAKGQSPGVEDSCGGRAEALTGVLNQSETQAESPSLSYFLFFFFIVVDL